MKRSRLYVIVTGVLALGVIGCCTGQSCIKKQRTAPLTVKEYLHQTQGTAAPAAKTEAASVAATVPSMPVAAGYNFGDYRSSTLTTKAWQSLAEKNTDAVVVYTNKCIDMYAPQAIKMQSELKDYPSGDPQTVFSYWAVNDVATSLYIQGEAYR
jgi:hypothetical protein